MYLGWGVFVLVTIGDRNVFLLFKPLNSSRVIIKMLLSLSPLKEVSCDIDLVVWDPRLDILPQCFIFAVDVTTFLPAGEEGFVCVDDQPTGFFCGGASDAG